MNGNKCWIIMGVSILLLLSVYIVSSRIDLTGRDNLYTYVEVTWHYHPGLEMNFDVADKYYNLTFNVSLSSGAFTWDGDGNLTCHVAGTYLANFMACGSGQNNHEYQLGIGVNGIVQAKTVAHKKMAAGGDVTVMSGTSIISLNATDVVSLKIRDRGGTGTGLYVHANFNLVRLDD